ncbi:hypothetical protein D7V91_01015 [bacterium 1xD42-67]|nr:hypothetical protein D7V91_01015 [bacterium 1xD42-67]
MMRCPICTQELDPNARFCGRCGKKIPRCPVCGTVLYERSRFCANDGAPLPEELFADLPPAGGGAPDRAAPPPERPAPRPSPEPPQRGGKRGTGTVALIVLLLLLAAAAAGGIWYVVQNGLPSFEGGADASSSEDRDQKDRDDRDRPGDESEEEDEEEREIQKALAQAGVFASVREYDNALAVIREALEDHPRSRELKDALEDHEEGYASTLLSDVDWMVEEGHLEEAKVLLDHGLTALPGRSDLQDKLRQVEDLIAQGSSPTPVSMDAVTAITASSFLREPGLDLYHTPDRTVDGDLRTAWVEGIDGPGIGESITFVFDRAYLISGIRINAGYQKSEELYQMNDRPASFTLTFSDGVQQTMLLQDVDALQDIPLDFPVETDRVELTITSLYPGTTYQDAVISEILFY